MKFSRMVMLSLIVGLAGGIVAKYWNQSRRPIVDTSPKVELGECWEGETLSGAFTVRNAGGSRLTFKVTSISCNCATIGRKDFALEAKEAVDVPVEVKTNGRRGSFQVFAKLETNIPENKNITIAITGMAHPLLKSDMEKGIDFGALAAEGLPANRDLIVEPSDRATEEDIFSQATILASDPFLQGTIEKSDNGTLKIVAALSNETPLGQYVGHLRVALQTMELSIPVYAQVTGNERLDPPSLFFSSLAPGQAVEKSCVLIGVEETQEVQLDTPHDIPENTLSTRLAHEDGKTVVYVTARGMDTPHVLNASLRIINAGQHRTIQLPIMAVSTGRPTSS